MPPKSRQAAAARKPRRKDKKNVVNGQAHIKSTFNNTIVSITDPSGAVISWASSGQVGFKGSRKSTPYAAQMAAEAAARRAQEHGLKKVDVFVKGPVRVARPPSVRSLRRALRSVRFRTSPRSPTTAFARRSVAATEHCSGARNDNRHPSVSYRHRERHIADVPRKDTTCSLHSAPR